MEFTGLIHIVIALCVLGIIAYCVNLIPGLPAPIKQVAMILIILFGCLWLLGKSGFSL